VSQNPAKGDISGVGLILIGHFHPGSSRMRPSEYWSQLGCPLATNACASANSAIVQDRKGLGYRRRAHLERRSCR
jgi:hypothetical protein